VKLARVTGNVVATVKHPAFHGGKLMLVQPLDEQGKAAGSTFIALDRAQAGPGDLVLVMQEGNGVRQLLKDPKAPIRSVIVGIVDEVALAPAPAGKGKSAR
jgi:microcompartment protein CcmK/EutM